MFCCSSGDSQDKVDTATKDNCQGAIDPEEHEHRVEKPYPGLSDCCAVLCDIDQNGSDADEPCRDEEALSRMCDRCRESGRVEVES